MNILIEARFYYKVSLIFDHSRLAIIEVHVAVEVGRALWIP